ncbi:MAG: hypothetical protein LC645_02295 [Geobacteraceae bacterium]|nr:hypothetical protein [Geobacteraceae bacterium]
MSCGIELEWEDYRLEWGLDTYLEQMEQGLQHQLKQIGAAGQKRNKEQGQEQERSA